MFMSSKQDVCSIKSVVSGSTRIVTKQDLCFNIKPLIESNSTQKSIHKPNNIRGFSLWHEESDLVIEVVTALEQVPWHVKGSKQAVGFVKESCRYLLGHSQIRDELMNAVLDEKREERLSFIKDHLTESLVSMQGHLFRAPDLSNLANLMNLSLKDEISSSFSCKLISGDFSTGVSVLEHLQDTELIKKNASLRHGKRTEETNVILEEIRSSSTLLKTSLERMIERHPKPSWFLTDLTKQGCF